MTNNETLNQATAVKKERSYLFDTFRGLLIWTIPVSHFTMMAGHFSQPSLSGVVYITINVFVMQAFVFLSGYFSKKPERARETAFKTFLFPYLLLVPFFYGVRYWIFGKAVLSWTEVPFALWYLVALFIYRFFLVDFVKSKYILQISIILYLIAGQIPWMSATLSLGRVISYFPFFIIGYLCQKEHLAKIQSLKMWQTITLGVIMIGISILLAFTKPVPAAFYLLSTPDSLLGIPWYVGIPMRIADFIIPCGWIIFMLNILPKGKNYLTYVGMNTMAVYILHLVVRQVIKSYGGLPDGGNPQDPNWLIYYGCIFGLASLCVVVFSSPPVSKGYDGFFAILYNKVYLNLKRFAKWALGIRDS